MTNNDYLFGYHAVKTALNHLDTHEINQVTLFVNRQKRQQRTEQLLSLAKKKSIKVVLKSKAELDKITNGNHQGIILDYPNRSSTAEVKSEAYLETLLETHHEKDNFFLILDGVQDPHNLGACLRTADASGIQAVIIPKDKAVSLTPTVRKIACGADQYVPLIQVTNLARTIDLLKTYHIWIIGTAGEAKKSLYDADLRGNIALVIGAEEKGLRRLTRDKCDHLISIPMFGHVESLNLSVSTGICLFEATRRRNIVSSDKR